MYSLLNKRSVFGHAGHNGFVDEEALLGRLGVSNTLKGHEGCVNTLRWNSAGTRLASGSDDTQFKIWGCDGGVQINYQTDHTDNIFGVEFLHGGDDRIIATGSGDHTMKIHDITRPGENEATVTWKAQGRVKRLATAEDAPQLFWAVSEDGILWQIDVRTSDGNSLVSSNGSSMFKSLAVCQGRTDLIAIGANQKSTLMFDRRNMDSVLMALESADAQCHPYRDVFTTHVAFDYDGTELIVNQGNGCIYLYDVRSDGRPSPTVMERLDDVLAEAPPRSRPVELLPRINRKSAGPLASSPPTKFAQDRNKEIALLATNLYDACKYHQGIQLYSTALAWQNESLDRSILLTNRSIGYLKRRWEGDIYASIRDNIEALTLNPYHAKALVCLTNGMILLEQWETADKCVQLYRQRFPGDNNINKFEAQVDIALAGIADELELGYSPSTRPGRAPRPRSGRRNPTAEEPPRHILASKTGYRDYIERYTGHINQNTDMKEANFFGSKNQYIVSGSDDGSMIFWSRETGNIVTAFTADSDILNVVQPHPTKFMLATSGIEYDIRFWEPMPEDYQEERRIADVVDYFGNRSAFGLSHLSPFLGLPDIRRINGPFDPQIIELDQLPPECNVQ